MIFFSGAVLFCSLIWTGLRMICILKASKNIHRILKEKEEANQEEDERQDDTSEMTTFQKLGHAITTHVGKPMKLFWRFDVIPVLWLLPTIIFRLSVFCLICTWSSTFYMNEVGSAPKALGILIPVLLLFTLVLVGLMLVGKSIHLKWQEALVNSFSSSILPIYVDVFLLVSLYLKYCRTCSTIYKSTLVTMRIATND